MDAEKGGKALPQENEKDKKKLQQLLEVHH